MILLHIEHPAKSQFSPNFYTNLIRRTYLNHSPVSESPVVAGQTCLHGFVFSFNMQKKIMRFEFSIYPSIDAWDILLFHCVTYTRLGKLHGQIHHQYNEQTFRNKSMCFQAPQLSSSQINREVSEWNKSCKGINYKEKLNISCFFRSAMFQWLKNKAYVKEISPFKAVELLQGCLLIPHVS